MGCFKSKGKNPNQSSHNTEVVNPEGTPTFPPQAEEIDDNKGDINKYLQANGSDGENDEKEKQRMKEIEGKKEATIQEGDFHTIEQVEAATKSPERKSWRKPSILFSARGRVG